MGSSSSQPPRSIAKRSLFEEASKSSSLKRILVRDEVVEPESNTCFFLGEEQNELQESSEEDLIGFKSESHSESSSSRLIKESNATPASFTEQMYLCVAISVVAILYVSLIALESQWTNHASACLQQHNCFTFQLQTTQTTDSTTLRELWFGFETTLPFTS
ncbi:hypothetical protein PIB30_022890 [Stylosanthes scabra]|uniref:Uncharacterized protein n=1 Tax=Stylosanthes scabra TaxID=79078 RepID=A0ABU6Y9I3_9FABA|nr:hypothetical protein [Stylosanthes scabra]